MLIVLAFLLTITGPAQATEASCFGAAVFEQHCQGQSEAKSVSPSISYAEKHNWGLGILRNSNLCRHGQPRQGAVHVCRLGARRGKVTVALVGDSHSAHWRPGFDRVAKSKGWRALSLVEPGCDYNLVNRPRYGFADQRACRAWRLDIPRFLARHKQIKTVFFAQYSYQEPRKDEISSYQAAWRLLPPSVKRVIVIRDNPRSAPDNYQCIATAVKARQAPGSTCARQRGVALTEDWAATAATSFVERNGSVIDLSDSFCSATLCYPVIGGALVYAEGNHQTPSFNRTLAGAFIRALEKIGPIE